MKKKDVVIFANTKTMSNTDWLKARRNGIGGSDAGAICGVNPWRTAIDVWMDKTSKDEPEEKTNEAMRVGHDLEDYVAKRFTEQTGKKVQRKNAILQHPNYEWMLANVDRVIVGENALLECKTANAYKAKEWAEDKIPESYEIQCHHYMAVAGCEKVYIACLIMGVDFVVREIKRDEELIADLIGIEKDFWEQNVKAGEMPAPDGSEAAGKALVNKYINAVEDAVELGDEYAAKLERMDEIETLVNTLTKEQNKLKQEIQAEMKENDTAYIGERRLTWKVQAGKSNVDGKKLKAEMPDLYEKYLKVGNPTRVFRWKTTTKKED